MAHPVFRHRFRCPFSVCIPLHPTLHPALPVVGTFQRQRIPDSWQKTHPYSTTKAFDKGGAVQCGEGFVLWFERYPSSEDMYVGACENPILSRMNIVEKLPKLAVSLALGTLLTVTGK